MKLIHQKGIWNKIPPNKNHLEITHHNPKFPECETMSFCLCQDARFQLYGHGGEATAESGWKSNPGGSLVERHSQKIDV